MFSSNKIAENARGVGKDIHRSFGWNMRNVPHHAYIERGDYATPATRLVRSGFSSGNGFYGTANLLLPKRCYCSNIFFFFFWLLLFEISGGKSAEAKGWLFIFVASVSSFNTEIRMTMNAAVRHERCFELKKITQIYVAYVLAV